MDNKEVNKTMKKHLSMLLLVCLIGSLAVSCSKTNDNQPGTQGSSTIHENANTGNTQGELTAIRRIDVDLTALSSTMVFAEVYNIMLNPNDYTGKTMKMRGTYSSSYNAETGYYYHYVVIADTSACCQQGIGFIWNGDHAYPDDYPEENARIEVIGVFESYKRFDSTYYRLAVDDIAIQP